MGSDNPPNDDKNKFNDELNLQKNSYSEEYNNQNNNKTFRQRLGSDPQKKPAESEKLQPIRRHSNLRDINNFQNQISSKNVIPPFHNSIGAFPKKNNNESPSLIERNKSRKLSQQYCADFKKSYMASSKISFLNHLADSLNHGTAIPIEEIEKFKEEYLPKYFLDWRSIEDPRTGVKYWKNFGKIYPDKNNKTHKEKMETKTIGTSEPFYIKRGWLYHYLMNNYARSKKENPLIVVNRNNILEDSYNQFLRTKDLNLTRDLKIKFFNEQNQDEEGIYREWYQCLFKEILSPNKKLFLFNPYKSLEPNTIIFYPKYHGMKLELYEFIGKLLIKAVADIIFIRNFNINPVILKSITKRPIILDDIKYYNLDLYQKLKYINDTPVRGNRQLESIRFLWNYRDENNIIKELELVPGGRNIFLNDNNKKTFIDKVIYVEAIRPYEEQIIYSQKGLYSLIGQEVQGIFSVEELNFLITGQDDIDLNDWKENTIYKGIYNEYHPMIILFWQKLSSMNKNEIIKFLEFSTGDRSVPIDGFGSLKGIGGRIQKFTIEPHTNYSAENPDQYVFYKIEAKRLYNTIILPQYRNRQELDQAFNAILYNKI